MALDMTASPLKNFIACPSRLRTVLPAARARAGERGAALVELALIMPVALTILFGIAQFGLALNSASDETHVANEVARYATVNQNPASSGSLQEWGKTQIDSKALQGEKVCIAFPNGKELGNAVEVTVKGTINWIPILKLKVSTTSVEGKAVMRLEAKSTFEAGCSK